MKSLFNQTSGHEYDVISNIKFIEACQNNCNMDKCLGTEHRIQISQDDNFKLSRYRASNNTTWLYI